MKITTKRNKEFEIGKWYKHPLSNSYFAIDGKGILNMDRELFTRNDHWTVLRYTTMNVDKNILSISGFIGTGSSRIGCSSTAGKFTKVELDKEGCEFFMADVAGSYLKIYADEITSMDVAK